MNLHQIASGAISAVNPNTRATLRASAGYSIDGVGRQVPQYAPDAPVTAQVQQLTTRDLMHLDAMNIQGSQRKVYLNGSVSAISRVNQRGGDILIIGGTTWLTTAVIEQFPEWCSVAVTQQND